MSLASLVRDRLFPRDVYYGWYIAIAGAGSSFLILGITIFGFGVFISRFQEEYGWSVKAIALGFSLRSLEQGMLSPFMGYVMDRLGPRRVAVIGVVIVAASLFIFAQARTLPVYYTASIVMAIGQSLGGFSAFTLAAMRWFVKKRGRAMGVISIGNGFGYSVALIIAALNSAFGFRDTLMILGVAVLVLGVPLALVIRDRPESLGYLPDGERLLDGKSSQPKGSSEAKSKALPSGTGLELSQVLRIPAFYLLVLTSVSMSAGQSAWNTFQIPALEAAGFSLKVAASMVSIYGLVQIPLRFGTGWLGDFLGRRRLGTAALILQSIGLLVFAFLTPGRFWLLPVYYLTYAAGHAGWFIAGQTITADYFGARQFATIRGLAQSLQVPMGILAPIFVGSMFDRYGNYQLAFIFLGILSSTAAIWFSLIRRPMWIDLPPAAPVAEPAEPSKQSGPTTQGRSDT
ncbi:MAG: MFS transporter [Chloroflexota bacterium]